MIDTKTRQQLHKELKLTTIGEGTKIKNEVDTGNPSLSIGVKKKLPKEQLKKSEIVPVKIDGVPTDVVETGKIEAFGLLKALEFTQRMRPFPCGISGGHPCYDDKTRILTKNGLKYFSELTKEDEIATLKSGKELEYQNPINILKFPYKGGMIHFKSQNIDLMVTPNHKIYFKNRRSPKPFMLEEAQKVLMANSWQNIQLKRNCEWHCKDMETFELPPSHRRILYENYKQWNGTKIDFTRKYPVDYRTVRRWSNEGQKPLVCYSPYKFQIEDWLEFLGWYISEGSAYGNVITINEKSGRYHSEIFRLLRKMGINPFISSQKTIQFSHLELVQYLKQFGIAKQKYIPDDIKALPKNKLEILLDALMKGDGHIENNAYRHYKTVSWRLANDVLEIAFKCGYGVSLSQYEDKPHEYNKRIIKGGIGYRIGFSRKKLTPRLGNIPLKVNYEGDIYCIEIPNHIIFIERNGKTCWSGNSISAGTIGAPCRIPGNDTQFILTNNHVGANCNNAEIGDSFLQPGAYDGGTISDEVGYLAWFEKIKFIGENNNSNCAITKTLTSVMNYFLKLLGRSSRLEAHSTAYPVNYIDAALIGIKNPNLVIQEILKIGEIMGIGTAELGMEVQKTGRSTEWMSDKIIQKNVSTIVSYGENKEAYFEGQFMSGPMSAPGDSGSAILNMQRLIVGLLFAGSDLVMIFNPIDLVINASGLEF